MKRITLFIVLMLALSLSVAGQLRSTPDIEISLVSQDPDPVEAGRYVELRFKLENFGYIDAEDVEVEMLPKFPFSLEPGEVKIKKLGTLFGSQIGVNAYTVDYKVRVSKDALEGENEIDIRWRYEEGIWIKATVMVDVQTPTALLTLKEFSSDPLRIKPGEVADIELVLENAAYSFIKDVKVKLNLITIRQSATGVSVEEIPFSPIGSSDEKIISQIDGKSEEKVTFRMVANADAATMIYKVPVTISYADSLGTRYNQTNIISLIVGDEPDLIVGIDASEIYKVGQTGKVSIKFVNKGFSDVKFLYVKVKPSPNYKVLSAEDAYLGNIDSDDYETAEFNIYLKSKDNGHAIIPLEIEFKDANNVEYSRTIDLKMKLLTEEEAVLVGLKTKSIWPGILITLGIVIVGFFLYRSWKRRKKEK